MLIVDSIQTLYNDALDSPAGSVTQVKDCTMALMHLAKGQGITVFVIGHVNKEGSIAGPKVLEHMVDCVLYFEGDRHTFCRILRAAKNRFGATNEIGVFEMEDNGLREVENPSQLLLSGRCWQRCRPWWSRRRAAIRVGPATALTTTGRPCCWRCWRNEGG